VRLGEAVAVDWRPQPTSPRELQGPRTSTSPTIVFGSTHMDLSTFRHAGQCEHRSTSDPALLRAILKVRDGAGGGYWWVECGSCECGWQVAHYAESVG
jgi:hypothetical protein